MSANGFDILEGFHPIVPIMLYDANIAQEMSARLLNEGIFVMGFLLPSSSKKQG